MRLNIKSMISKRSIIMLFALGILVVGLTIGRTYSWFVSKSPVETTVTLEELIVESEFEEIEPDLFQPGMSAEISGVLKNTGTLNAVLSLKENTQINFKYSDDDKTPWTGAEWVGDTEGAVTTVIRADEYGYGQNQEGLIEWAWFYNMSKPEDKYLLLVPGAEVNMHVNADFNGSVMGDKYQKAGLKIGGQVLATQTLDGAMSAQFGVTFDDLGIYFGGTLRSVKQLPEDIKAQLEVIFNQ